MSTPVRQRKDIWLEDERDPADGTWNQTVLAYALAFGVLSAPTPGKPDTWDLAYQAAVHDMDPLPPPGDLRASCQHQTWYFLPWHRMYLFHYEQVLRAIIAELASPDIADETVETWALPYWNYQDGRHRTLPRAFQADTLPDGTTNPLAQAARYPWVQSGQYGLEDREVAVGGWWRHRDFALPGSPSFAGSDAYGTRHRPLENAINGSLEVTPHGSVHNYVGPDMGRFDRAGFDPIFWLHHCNIDRLWEVWRRHRGSDPATGGWTTQTFDFLDVVGNPWSRTPAAVVDIATLEYSYEDTSPPPGATAATRTRTGGVEIVDGAGAAADGVEGDGVEGDGAWRRELPLRPLGSASESMVLTTSPQTVGVPLTPEPGLITRAERPAPARMILEVGNVQLRRDDQRRVDHGEAVVATYAVYLVGTDPEVDAYVGNLPLFGLRESTSGERHELAYSFDITDAVGALDAADTWDGEQAAIRVEPVAPERYEGHDTEVVPVTVGNFTISYQ